jgi:hypothetical protein
MKFIPLLFSTDMVRALVRKTATRRTRGLAEINKAPKEWELLSFDGLEAVFAHILSGDIARIKNPFGGPGDILWVRETWKFDPSLGYIYKATSSPTISGWKPSIHMPRQAARFYLEVQSVNIEPLMTITQEEAIAEGIEPVLSDKWKNYLTDSFVPYWDYPLASFYSLWESIHGRKSYFENPWVWAITFKISTKHTKSL